VIRRPWPRWRPVASDQVTSQLDALGLEGRHDAAPNVVKLAGTPDALVVSDCVELRAQSGSGVRYVDQDVTLARAADTWSVTSVVVNNDGRPQSGLSLGCIPRHHGERVEASVQTLFDGIVSDYRKPAERLSDEVLGLLGDPLRPVVIEVFDQQAAEGLYRDAREENFYEALGSDPTAGGTSFIVGVCSLLPEGRFARSVETGEIVESTWLFQPGDVMYTTVMVASTADGNGGFRDTITNFGDLEYPSDCWDRAR
jgi:hypothetical protein